MKVALLADIHGNADALAAVLRAAREEGVARILVAGDLVGYYYAADRVLELLGEWRCDSVRGNHEEMLADWRAGKRRDQIRRKYGSAFEVACQRLTPRQLDQLEGLSHPLVLRIGGRRVAVCHGAPWDLDEYIYPDAPEEKPRAMLDSDFDLVIFGHTHYPVVWRFGGAAVVNPGSVGQTRDYVPGACWVLWDTDGGTFTLRRETFDWEPVQTEARQRDPHLPYLADVLSRTR